MLWKIDGGDNVKRRVAVCKAFDKCLAIAQVILLIAQDISLISREIVGTPAESP